MEMTGNNLMADLEAAQAEVAKQKATIEEFAAKLAEAGIKLEAFSAELMQAKTDYEAKINEMADAISAKDDQIAALSQEKDEVSKKLADAENKLKLAPVADTTGGIDPVALGSDKEPVDHVAELNKLSGGAKILYYREHKKEIDAAFKPQK